LHKPDLIVQMMDRAEGARGVTALTETRTVRPATEIARSAQSARRDLLRFTAEAAEISQRKLLLCAETDDGGGFVRLHVENGEQSSDLD
jgi:hypothetical protein